MDTTDVFIVGAGPTGLVLALWLVRQGVRVRIVDQTSAPGTTSRAIAVVPRTLELYRQVGLAETLVERGLKLGAVNLWIRAEPVAHLKLGEMGSGLSPYPFLLMFPQDEHEQLLIEQLERHGVRVERSTTLVGFESHGDHVVVRVSDSAGSYWRLSSRISRWLRRREIDRPPGARDSVRRRNVCPHVLCRRCRCQGTHGERRAARGHSMSLIFSDSFRLPEKGALA